MAVSTTRPRLDAVLHGQDFPAHRDDLVAAAERAGDEQTARAIRAIPPVEYGSRADVLASVPLDDDDHPLEQGGTGTSAD
jgi:hypothetical protein